MKRSKYISNWRKPEFSYIGRKWSNGYSVISVGESDYINGGPQLWSVFMTSGRERICTMSGDEIEDMLQKGNYHETK